MLARVYCYKGDAESKGLATEYAKQVIAASKYFTLYKSQTASNYNSIRYAEQIFGITVNEFSNLLIGNYMDMENTNTQQRFYLDGDKFKFFYETAIHISTGLYFRTINLIENTWQTVSSSVYVYLLSNSTSIEF